MQKSAATGQSVWPIVQRLLQLAGRQRGWFYLALVIDLSQALLLILGNHFNRRFFEAVSANDPTTFWLFVWLSLITQALNIPLSYFKVRGIGLFSERTLAKLRGLLASASTRLPVETLEQRHSGDMLSVLNADLGKLRTLLANNLIDLFGHVAALHRRFCLYRLGQLGPGAGFHHPHPVDLYRHLDADRPVSKRSEEMQDGNRQSQQRRHRTAFPGRWSSRPSTWPSLLDGRFHQANQDALKKGSWHCPAARP